MFLAPQPKHHFAANPNMVQSSINVRQIMCIRTKTTYFDKTERTRNKTHKNGKYDKSAVAKHIL